MANTTNLKREKIEGALRLLDDAAKETKEDISGLVREKYHNLERSISKVEPIVRQQFDNVSKKTSEAYEQGRKMAKEKAEFVDESVHTNPWSYIGGAALAGAIIGFLLGRK